jgi:4-hydroxy-tetrahydrodipicolinate reductase
MTDRPIKVAVNGALGRMGQTVLGAVEADPVTIAVGGADSAASADTVGVPGGNPVPLAPTLAELLSKVDADVVVDFSNGAGAVEAMAAATGAGVRVVSGSTGVQSGELERFGAIAAEKDIGIISASNFALGAVLMMYLAEVAGSHFAYADLIESHHEAKIDSPSGTALSIAEAARSGRDTDFTYNEPETVTLDEVRGGLMGGVNVHSARMPGRMARHELVFGTSGQTLSIIHDTINRDCYMPGVLMAVKRVMSLTGLMIGLDQVLGLRDPAKP